MEGREAREDADTNADLRFIRAAIGAAVAIGALEMMRKWEENDGGEDHHHDE